MVAAESIPVSSEIRSPQAALRLLDGRMDASDLLWELQCKMYGESTYESGSNMSRLLIEIFVERCYFSSFSLCPLSQTCSDCQP